MPEDKCSHPIIEVADHGDNVGECMLCDAMVTITPEGEITDE